MLTSRRTLFNELKDYVNKFVILEWEAIKFKITPGQIDDMVKEVEDLMKWWRGLTSVLNTCIEVKYYPIEFDILRHTIHLSFKYHTDNRPFTFEIPSFFLYNMPVTVYKIPSEEELKQKQINEFYGLNFRDKILTLDKLIYKYHQEVISRKAWLDEKLEV